MLDTRVNFLGMEMKTPFLIASGQLTGEGSRIQNWVQEMDTNHWAGIITKTYLKDCQLYMRPYLWNTNKFKGIGMQNAGPNLTEPSDEELKGLKESCSRIHDAGLVIIVSIMGRSVDEWRELTEKAHEAGADAIELNLSCPVKTVTLDKDKIGYHLSQVPEAAALVTETVKKHSKLPVIVKLTPNVTKIAEIAQAVKEAGADAVSAINTVQGIIGVDVETGVPYPSDIEGRSYISGLSGPIIRPIGLRNVADIAKEVQIPISGIGGINDWNSAVEYIMLGCSVVQVCTAVMWHGFKVGKKMHDGMVKFMDQKGYSKIDDFKGIALKYVTTEVEKMEVRARVDVDKCNGCGLCVVSCNETQFIAIKLGNGIIEINQEACGGCGLCKVVCKRDAISFVRIS